MNIWSQMISTLSGEFDHSNADEKALEILDLQIREASEALHQARIDLAEMIAQQKKCEEKGASLKQEISTLEGYVVSALDKNDEPLALEVAEKIAVHEETLKQENELREECDQSTRSIQRDIVQVQRNVKRLKRQLDTVRATENIQRAQIAMASRRGPHEERIRTARDSFSLMQKQQNRFIDPETTENSSTTDYDVELQMKLEVAGIVSSKNSPEKVLERLKKTTTK